MTKKMRFISIVTLVTILLSMVSFVSYAEETKDFRDVYLELAKAADETGDWSNPFSNPLRRYSGMFMMDLNMDDIPELFTYAATVTNYDEDGNVLYGNVDRSTPSFSKEDYNLVCGFCVKDGRVEAYYDWENDERSNCILLETVPGRKNNDVQLPSFAVKDEDGKLFLKGYNALFNAYLSFDGENFNYNMNNDAGYVDAKIPVANVEMYEEATRTKMTIYEAVETLMDRYEKAVADFKSGETLSEELVVSSWAETGVAEAVKKKLIPEEMLLGDLRESITRAEFFAIAVKLYEQVASKLPDGYDPSEFDGVSTDIDNNKYKDYIQKAYYYRITAGVPSPYSAIQLAFGADWYISREQIATMLARIVKIDKYEGWYPEYDAQYPFEITSDFKFSDNEKIADYALESVYYLYENDIIKGTGASEFSPANKASKEQAILLALRMYNSFDKLIAE